MLCVFPKLLMRRRPLALCQRVGRPFGWGEVHPPLPQPLVWLAGRGGLMATRPKKRDAGKTKGAEETKPLKPDKKGKNRKQDDDDDDDDDDDMGPASAAPLAEPKFVPKGGQGFRVKFEIPFRAKDIFRELCRPDEPLGLDKEFTSVDVVQPGVGGPGKVVRPSRHRAPSHTSAIAHDHIHGAPLTRPQFSVGFIRKSTFKNKLLGNTRARLTELDVRCPMPNDGLHGPASASRAAAQRATPVVPREAPERIAHPPAAGRDHRRRGYW